MIKHSKVLEKTVSSGMKESQEHVVNMMDLDGDIDDGTVVRFIEYAYTGDYTVPRTPEFDDGQEKAPGPSNTPPSAPTQLSEEMTEPPLTGNGAQVPVNDICAPPSHDWATPVSDFDPADWFMNKPPSYRGKKGAKKNYWTTGSTGNGLQGQSTKFIPSQETLAQRKETIWSNFVSRAVIKQVKPWEPRTPASPSEDYTIDLLCHARLYVFSHRFECGNLATLALQKLRLTLSRYSPDQGISSVIELARYTYCHTQDHEDVCDKLRKLIIEYLVCHLEKITKEKEFSVLLQEGGALAHDLLMESMARIG